MKKVYLIIGASSETGMAYINKLNKEDNVQIYASFRNRSEAFDVMLQNNHNIIPMQVDLADRSQVKDMIEKISADKVIPTHIAHFAASRYEFTRIKQWDEEKIRRDMEIGFYSFASICSSFLPKMAKAGYGRVVAMLSAVTLGTPPKCTAAYSACKYALMGFVKAAAAEYADKGITINAVSPNMMETKFLDGIDNRIVEMTAQNCAMKRNIQVDETVEAIDFLMSDKASYINGVNLNLSGGDYM